MVSDPFERFIPYTPILTRHGSAETGHKPYGQWIAFLPPPRDLQTLDEACDPFDNAWGRMIRVVCDSYSRSTFAA